MGGRIKDETAPDYMQAYAHAIHKIERETGILITKDFPAMKFFNLLDFCVHCEEEKEQMESDTRRR